MKKFIIFVLLPLFFACCPKFIPFTSTVIHDYQLTDTEIKQLHLFLSDKIILERRATDEDTDVIEERKSLKRISLNSLDKIIFLPKTSGIPIFIKKDQIRVSFEPDEYLTFSTDEPHNKEGIYYLYVEKYYVKGEMSKKRKISIGNRVFHRRGILTYNEKQYNVYAPFPKPHLMVREKKIEKDTKSKRTVKGME